MHPVPRCTFSGGLAKPFFSWQSTRAARRIAGQSLTFSALISLHERRSRNMMARIEGCELSARIKPHPNGEALSENLIPRTICTTDAPTGTHGGPPGRGVQWLACPEKNYSAPHGENERGRSALPERRLSAGRRLRQGWARPHHASREWGSPEGANRRFVPFGATLLVLFCSRQKRTLKTRRISPRREPAKAKELIQKSYGHMKYAQGGPHERFFHLRIRRRP